MVARLPLLLDVDRAYVARISPDGVRFTVTQASTGDCAGDLLGYTQSVARLPAFVRGALRTGSRRPIQDALTFPFTPQQRRMIWYERPRGTGRHPDPLGRRRWSAPWSSTSSGSADMGLRDPRRAAGRSPRRSGPGLPWRSSATTWSPTRRDAAPDEPMRLNVLANIADAAARRSRTTRCDSAKIVDALAELPWSSRAVRLAPADDPRRSIQGGAGQRAARRPQRTTGQTLVGLAAHARRRAFRRHRDRCSDGTGTDRRRGAVPAQRADLRRFAAYVSALRRAAAARTRRSTTRLPDC